MNGHNSLFDRVICKSRPIKFILGIVSFLVISLITAVVLDGSLEDFTQDFSWRGLLIPPTIIIYILTIAPIMSRMEKRSLKFLSHIISR